LLAAICVPLTASRFTAQAEDDPAKLFRKTEAPGAQASSLKIARQKSVVTTATSADGNSVSVQLTPVQNASGATVGFLPSLPALKDGEKVTVRVPGGGAMVVGGPNTDIYPPRAKPKDASK
jgi:hypothetical protein